MAIFMRCPCGTQLQAPTAFAGSRCECPNCGQVMTIPQASPDPPRRDEATGATPFGAPPQETDSKKPAAPAAATPTERSLQDEIPTDVVEFLDPPSRKIGKPSRRDWVKPLFEVMLDPRSIEWLLMLGGGLMVIGLVVWLASVGVFENPWILAVALGAGSLAVLGAGWYVVLKTRFRVAGQALTFLGCVVVPLNLWFYSAQNLITIADHLWIGGLVCCLLYIATVYVLRDPLFMYAVEAGATLTIVLLMGVLNWYHDASYLSLLLMGLGLVSLHAERAFPPGAKEFSREWFGMPLFWSGHAQIGVALAVLLGSQLLFLMPDELWRYVVGKKWEPILVTQWHMLAGGLWLAGTYAYLYSDLVVRRVGAYVYLAALCLVLGEVTLVGEQLRQEGLIAVLALTSLGVGLLRYVLADRDDRIARALPPLAVGLAVLPVFIGAVLHMRATSVLAGELGWAYATTPFFVGAMAISAIANRVSAYIWEPVSRFVTATFFFLSAAAIIVASAGGLRAAGVSDWPQQAAALMLIPMLYMLAARFWRGRIPERPLGWVAHAGTAVILLHVLAGLLEKPSVFFQPVPNSQTHLLIALVFIEAAAFYALAAVIRRRGANVYFAMAAACGAAWQLLGYFAVRGDYHTMLFAVLGLALLAASRWIGIILVDVYSVNGVEFKKYNGPGVPVFQGGSAILLVASLAALVQGFSRLAAGSAQLEWPGLTALALTTAASAAAICMAPSGGWRRVFATMTVALAAAAFLTLNLLIDLNGWQKLEIFCVAAGVLLLVASYVGRLREADEKPDDLVSLGFWLGSLFAAVPLLVAVFYYRFIADRMSHFDEFALLTVSILMLVSGLIGQVKATTLVGGLELAIYLVILLIVPQFAVGVYLAIGGALIFSLGLALSVYRDRLAEIPDRFARREGVFRFISWR